MDDTPWMRDILRFALTATPSTLPPWDPSTITITAGGGGNLTDPDDPGKDPRFRKLVEAILFGRRFLKTYNIVLLGVLLLFTAWHWGEKLYLRQRKRRITIQSLAGDEGDAWSSSSSTLEGNVTPPRPDKKAGSDDAAETTPLLAARLRPRRSAVCTPYYAVKAALQYQPPPIPIVNKTLPTNAVSLLVLAWLGLVVFYNLYRMPLNFMYLFVFADRCGIIFISNLPLLYLLAAKNQPVKFLTGYSYESLNIFHRRVGEVMCLEAFIHFAGMIAFWYGLLRRLGFTLGNFLLNRVVILGLLAFFAYELIYFTSLGSFRKRWYEVFLALHIILQVAGLAFLWFHHHTSRPYVGISLAIFLIDRLVYRLWLKSSTHAATLEVLEDNETILLSSSWDVSTRSPALRLLSHNMQHGWSPNEHIFISISELSRKHALQSHPFTIFSAAPNTHTSMTQDVQGSHAWFTLLIRAQAEYGFTNQLLTYAHTHSKAQIRLDGPYGSSHALNLLQSCSSAVLVAGGSGIAVAYPLLYSLLQPSADPETALAKSGRRVRLLWITHSPTHRLWIPEDKLKELQDWGLDVVVPPPTKLAGRPDAVSIVGEWVDAETSGKTGVVVSGPEGLVRDVRNTCARKMWQGSDVGVAVEKFGW
jgi:NAD(P)H-flavin reductase